MARKKPASAKQRKAQLQEKRAIKRGDIPPPPPQSAKQRGKGRIGGRSQTTLRSDAASDDPNVVAAAANAAHKIETSRRLQSSFLKLSPEFLAKSKERASNEALPRPITPDARYIPGELLPDPEFGSQEPQLSCPKRPKWRYEMSKKEVEKNEEGLFAKWLAETQGKVDQWRSRPSNPSTGDSSSAEVQGSTDPLETLRSPTYYEHNLEVWRQLWRVTELSSIILILVDSRCPPLHYPPSLQAYLANLRPQRKVILVLTKVDVVGPERANRWKAWLEQQYPGTRVVQVESYRPQVQERKGQGSRLRHLPHIPPPLLESLVEALKCSHKELLEPPEAIRDDPQKLQYWIPPVRREVDWTAVTDHVTVTQHNPSITSTNPQQGAPGQEPGSTENAEPNPANEPLTIGLIGQPNVGKSSLLNALFGAIKVRASRTPGKTKHFQTLFWSSEIRLVDCPGLVLPSLVPMELQVLSSVLPISQMPSIPSCISYAATLLPLEVVFGLAHPDEGAEKPQDKRTWREGADRPAQNETTEPKKWSAMDIMTAYALQKGWVTAKAGRPDVNRAGNAMLRALAESKVKWAFEPPARSWDAKASGANEENGIWLGLVDQGIEDVSDEESEGDSEDESGDKEPGLEDKESDETDGDDDDVEPPLTKSGMFGALAEESEGEASEDEESEGEKGAQLR